ncbi:methyltransferase [[Clostridium] sordellii]|nr:methyltransferase [[Clostridium] sordellii] [Paeniclostridium sordellii]
MELAFFIKGEDNRYDKFEEVHQQRAYTEEEVIEMLQESGFGNIKVYGDFTFNKPNEESERIFFICRK